MKSSKLKNRSKIVLFVKNPGINKIIFDNKYIRFISKLIRYRLLVLRENLDKNENNKDNKIDNDIDKNINNNEINNINNNDVINDNKDETEKMDKEKNSEIIVLQK